MSKLSKQRILFPVFFIAILTISCTSTQVIIPFPISVVKEACKGRCHVYNVEVLKNGELKFEGFSNTNYIGKKKIQLSNQEFYELKNKYSSVNFSKLNEIYDQRIYDLPKTIIKDGNNTISFKRNQSISDELKAFVKLLETILKNNNLL